MENVSKKSMYNIGYKPRSIRYDRSLLKYEPWWDKTGNKTGPLCSDRGLPTHSQELFSNLKSYIQYFYVLYFVFLYLTFCISMFLYFVFLNLTFCMFLYFVFLYLTFSISLSLSAAAAVYILAQICQKKQQASNSKHIWTFNNAQE